MYTLCILDHLTFRTDARIILNLLIYGIFFSYRVVGGGGGGALKITFFTCWERADLLALVCGV